MLTLKFKTSAGLVRQVPQVAFHYNESSGQPMQHSALTIGIAGIGQMGCSAAVAFQRAGHRVLLWARNADRLRAVQSKTDELLKWSEDHLGPALRLGGSIHLEEDLHRLDAESDVFLDCILEILDEKIALFQKLTLAQQRLLLSATSGLSITQMGRGAGCESLLVGGTFGILPI
ncbi:MAG: 3-hydroxyacyl-CoA dehydrogenase NAD-binding domain-containing protein [Pirellulaceae bacterium]